MPFVPAIGDALGINPVPGPSIEERTGPHHYIRREVDDGLAVRPEGSVGKRRVDHDIIRYLH